MRPSPCLQKGFWNRSLDEFKRLSNIALNLEGIKGPSGPYLLYNFQDAESVRNCRTMSDQDIGGYSTAHLDWEPPTSSTEGSKNPATSPSPLASPPPAISSNTYSARGTGFSRFHGSISTKLPRNKPEVERSGYAAFRTAEQRATLFGKSLWDIDPYVYLALRIRSDGRSYLVNVQTESVVPTDLHQHRLFARRPGHWETVLIKWNDLVRTNHGFVVEPQTEILRQRVQTIGIGLTDRVPGPFELCISRIWATNNPDEADEGVEYRVVDGANTPSGGDGALFDKEGKQVHWNSY